MPLVNYEADSSEEEEDNNNNQTTIDLKTSTSRRLHLPTPSQTSSKITFNDDNDELKAKTKIESSSNLFLNLPQPHDNSILNKNLDSNELIEGELEDIVRGDNKTYAKNLPQLPKSIKRKRDGPVKIFIPTVEQDSDEDDTPKRQPKNIKRNCSLLNALPPPAHDDENPMKSMPVVKNPSTTAPQTSSTGLFIPYSLNKKQQQKKSTTSNEQTKVDSDIDDDDDDDQTDFLGLTKSNAVEINNTDVESVLRETFPKSRPIVIEQSSLPNSTDDFEDFNTNEEEPNQTEIMNDDDELLKYLPKSERFNEIKSVHIDSMLSESSKIQLLKNRTEERETMLAQAAIHVPKGEIRKRSQITYLIAKAQHDDLQLKNMWSEQKLTKRQTQAKYGF